jgi:hypothetical protein
MNKRIVGLSLGFQLVGIACTGSLAEQGHPCPCASQWMCCASLHVCVPEGNTCPTPDSGVGVSEPEAGLDEAGLDAATSVDAPQTRDAAPAPVGIIYLDSGVGGLCSMDDAGTSATGSDAGSPVDPDAAVPSVDAEAAVSCGCTRRPGSGNTSDCPAGLGEYGSGTIGPNGGTVQVQGRQFAASGVAAQLAFPPTAIAIPTDIKLIETAIPPPQDLLDWSPVYLAEPAGLAVAARTPIRLPWSSGPFPAPVGPSSTTAAGLSIWFSADGTCFTRLPDSYTNAGFEQGSVTQLGYFIVGTPRTAGAASCP